MKNDSDDVNATERLFIKDLRPNMNDLCLMGTIINIKVQVSIKSKENRKHGIFLVLHIGRSLTFRKDGFFSAA
jgi:hypothetical protein